MHLAPLTSETLARSPIAVPPLARRSDMSFDPIENAKIVRYLEAGGVTTLLYGGNAALAHIALSEYRALLKMLMRLAGDDMVMIPSVGPNYGMAMDQAYILKDFPFPTAMWLPTRDGTTPAGVATGVRRFVDRLGRPIVLYIKHEDYVDAPTVESMVDDGLISFIKYALVRPDYSRDPLLADLVQAVGPSRIVSGMGEQPAVDDLRDFGLPTFTSGCVCLAPRLSAAMLRAIQEERFDDAVAIRNQFAPLEAIRDQVSPVRVLHEAVRLAGVADTGAICPLWSSIDDTTMNRVAIAAQALAAHDQAAAATETPEMTADTSASTDDGGHADETHDAASLGGLGALGATVAAGGLAAAGAQFAGATEGETLEVAAEGDEFTMSAEDDVEMSPEDSAGFDWSASPDESAEFPEQDSKAMSADEIEMVADDPDATVPEAATPWPSAAAAEPNGESEWPEMTIEEPEAGDDFLVSPGVEMTEADSEPQWPEESNEAATPLTTPAEPKPFDVDAEMERFLANEDVKGIYNQSDVAPPTMSEPMLPLGEAIPFDSEPNDWSVEHASQTPAVAGNMPENNDIASPLTGSLEASDDDDLNFFLAQDDANDAPAPPTKTTPWPIPAEDSDPIEMVDDIEVVEDDLPGFADEDDDKPPKA